MLEVARKRFTVQEFDRMGETGVLAEGDRVELIDGEIVQMNPIGTRHVACVARCDRLLARGAGDAAIVFVQSPIQLGAYSEPQPDLAVVQPRLDFYESARPTASDVLLLVEVADTTLGYDRGTKVPLYARAGVPEVWVVDLGGAQVYVYREPTPDG